MDRSNLDEVWQQLQDPQIMEIAFAIMPTEIDLIEMMVEGQVPIIPHIVERVELGVNFAKYERKL